MGFELKPNRPIGRGARNAILEQTRAMRAALAGIRSSGAVADAAIHELRKRGKRSRALLRLLRPAIGDTEYRRGNRLVRDAARALAGARDAAVVVEVFGDYRRARPRCVGASAGRAAAGFLAEASREQARIARVPERVHEVRACLVALDRSLRAADPGGDEPALRGLRELYRRGRRAYARAARSGDPDALHELRKQLKYLRHAAEFLGPSWPGELEALAKEARATADLLGDAHDRAVLGERLRALARQSPEHTRELERLADSVGEWSREPEAEALARAARVYGDKPDAFTRRVACGLATERRLRELANQAG